MKYYTILIALFLCTTNGLCQNNCDSIFLPGSPLFYEDNPTYVDEHEDDYMWQFSTPSAQGMNEDILEAGLNYLNASPSVFSMLVLRNDYLIAEEYYNDSNSNHSNNIHSASKSIVSAMIGIALEQGYIDSLEQSIFDFFPNSSALTIAPEKENITIRHLLNMTSGLGWEENDTEYSIQWENNWVEAILSLPLEHPPGEVFNYSSGNTHLLSAILNDATGTSNCQFTIDNLIEPLGITIEHWGRDPQEVFSGGYNFYITPREMAKFGLLCLNGGTWLNEQLMPQDWIGAALENQVYDSGNYHYGFCWWNTVISGYQVHKAWGYGGQYICLIPELNITLVSTSDTYDSVDQLDMDYWIENYIIPSIDPNSTSFIASPFQTRLKIYPNPSNDLITFEFLGSNRLSEHNKLVILNGSGLVLKELKFVESEVKVQMNALPGGIYFYKVMDSDKMVGAGRFVIEE